YRFARGVDYQLQVTAMERATALILEIVGGVPGPLTEVIAAESMPVSKEIRLRKNQISRLLGVTVADDKVSQILTALGMTVSQATEGWQVKVPSFRSDITMEADLIEEIARIYGYQQIPTTRLSTPIQTQVQPETELSAPRCAALLVDRGYHQAITYSFI